MVNLCGNGTCIQSLPEVHVKNIFEIFMPKLERKYFQAENQKQEYFC